MRCACAWALVLPPIFTLAVVAAGCSLDRSNHIQRDRDGGGSCERCSDGIDCTVDLCTASGTCENRPDPARCTDQPGGQCDVARSCVYETCNMDNCFPGPCQVNRCEGNRCVLESSCAAGEFCCAGQCAPLDCNDDNPCTVDRCGATGCEHTPTTGVVDCFDGVFCTGPDTCEGDVCRGTDAFCPEECDEDRDRCVGCIVDPMTGDVSGCPPAGAGPFTPCGGFDPGNVCDETGTRSRVHTTYDCMDGTCVPTETVETEACRVDRSGVQCGNTVCDPWSSCIYSRTCDESGDRTRTCRDQLCNGGSCTTSTRTESRSNDSFCDRNTDDVDCGTRSCDSNQSNWNCPYPNECVESVTGTQPCTDRRCQNGSCRDFATNQAATCSRNTDGDPCGPGVDCTGAMCANFSGTCDETGTRDCEDNRCSAGSCQILGMVTENCTRNTNGDTCSDGVSCTNPDSCSGGSCSGVQNDSNCDDGAFCNGAETCQAGGCTSGNDPCPGQMCDESNDQCVDCMTDPDCIGTTPFCVSGACVECKNNGDCPMGNCNTTTHTCA